MFLSGFFAGGAITMYCLYCYLMMSFWYMKQDESLKSKIIFALSPITYIMYMISEIFNGDK